MKMDKRSVVSPYSGLLLRHEKEWSIVHATRVSPASTLSEWGPRVHGQPVEKFVQRDVLSRICTVATTPALEGTDLVRVRPGRGWCLVSPLSESEGAIITPDTEDPQGTRERPSTWPPWLLGSHRTDQRHSPPWQRRKLARVTQSVCAGARVQPVLLAAQPS